MSKSELIKEITEKIFALHNAHYQNKETGLIDKDKSPNSNTIYHLYNDGEITYQKGGSAYLQRSEFISSPHIYRYISDSPYNFPKQMGNGNSYAILTQQESEEMRLKMLEISKMK